MGRDEMADDLPGAPEGYCESGIHYIGDADECERCQIWEERRRRARAADR